VYGVGEREALTRGVPTAVAWTPMNAAQSHWRDRPAMLRDTPMRAPVLRSTLLAAAMTLLVGSSALAAAPTIIVSSADQTFTSAPGDFLNPCSQDLTVTFTGYIRVTTFYDQAGNVDHQVITSPGFRIAVTGPNGKSLSGVSSALNFITRTDTSISIVVVGQQFRFTIPGSGSVMSFDGRLAVFIDFATDPPTFTATFTGNSDNKVDPYCSYLGAS
jgi:hypothetical protein